LKRCFQVLHDFGGDDVGFFSVSAFPRFSFQQGAVFEAFMFEPGAQPGVD